MHGCSIMSTLQSHGCSYPDSPVHGFSRQKYWSRSPFPPPGVLTNQGSHPHLPHLLHWQADSLPQLQLEIPLLKIKEEKKSRKRKQQLNLANQPGEPLMILLILNCNTWFVFHSNLLVNLGLFQPPFKFFTENSICPSTNL